MRITAMSLFTLLSAPRVATAFSSAAKFGIRVRIRTATFLALIGS